MDSSPLIALARIGQLDLIRHLAGEVFIPPAVSNELSPSTGRKGSALLRNAQASWIRVKSPYTAALRRVSVKLGLGERESIALADTTGLELLVDEIDARTEAQRLGVRVIGTAGLLLEAKHQAVVSQVRPVLDELIADGFRLSDDLYRLVLRRAGGR